MTDPRGLEGTLVPLSVADRFEPGEVPEGGRAFQGSRGTPESFSDDPLATTWERPNFEMERTFLSPGNPLTAQALRPAAAVVSGRSPMLARAAPATWVAR